MLVHCGHGEYGFSSRPGPWIIVLLSTLHRSMVYRLVKGLGPVLTYRH